MVQEARPIQIGEVTEDPKVDALIALIQDAAAFIQSKLTEAQFEQAAAAFVQVVSELQVNNG